MFKRLRVWNCFVAGSAMLILAVATSTALTAAEPSGCQGAIRLNVRWQQRDGDSDKFAERTASRDWLPGETAILICDTWDKHWCVSATRRCDALARKIAPLVDQARAHGVHIIHSPSDTMDFYRDHPARRRVSEMPVVAPPSPIAACPLDRAREGSLPIDDSDGGCDCQPPCKNVNQKAWTRQHPAIAIRDTDLITDSGQEVYNYLVHEGIKNVIYLGVHTNMCVLGRSFGIRQMTRLAFNTVLVRDLTDTMYNPRKRPFVEHAAGTDLIVRHIEQHWCPTTTSAALVEGLR
jgi:nicotinamidase-related amidase